MQFPELDIRTVIGLLVIGNLGALATLVAYWRRVRGEGTGLLFMAGNLVQAIAWSLLYLRGFAPELLSVQLGNSLLLCSFALEALAIAKAAGGGPRLGPAYVAVTAAGVALFLLLAGTPNGRVVGSSLASVGPFALLSASVLRRRGGSALRSLIGLGSALFCLIMLGRAWAGFAGGPDFGLMTPALIQSLAFIPVFLFLIVGTIGFILLLKEGADLRLRESEEQYRTLVERASEAIIIAQDERFAFVNRRMAELLGVPVQDLVGKPFVDHIHPDDRDFVLANFRSRIAGGQPPDSYDLRLMGAGNRPVWTSLSATVVGWKGGPATLALLTDISTRKAAEERVAQLLAEKDILLREVHHRIKNNLAVAISLLSLQSETAGGKDPATVLLDARNRLQSLAQLYELLHRSGSFSEMSIRDFLSSLARELAAAFPLASALRFELELEDFALDVGRLTTLGIMVNEMITNSLKHAFAGQAEPCIRITASASSGRVRLSCSDNGPGLPPGFDAKASGGLGMQIIRMLAGQLDASLEIGEGPGTTYLVEFGRALPGQGR
ncbi:MAG TPA: histidine kinase dimerization/phosphoacceptor domain -containing protein [Rectinemataceae bacterium]|nr:histidine kinase dimerization/phosphoacceptor domain -containing protein [Rectinemataceae bacterium]